MEASNLEDTTVPEEPVVPYVPREVQFTREASSHPVVTSTDGNESHSEDQTPDNESVTTNDAGNSELEFLDHDSLDTEPNNDNYYDYNDDYEDGMDMDGQNSPPRLDALTHLSVSATESSVNDRPAPPEPVPISDEYNEEEDLYAVSEEDENDSDVEDSDIGDGLQFLDENNLTDFSDFYDSDNDSISPERDTTAAFTRGTTPPGMRYCTGHTFDRFGIRERHAEKFCKISTIEHQFLDAGNAMSVRQAIRCLIGTFTEETAADDSCFTIDNQKSAISTIGSRTRRIEEYRINIEDLVNTSSESDMLAFAQEILMDSIYRFPYEFRFQRRNSFISENKVSLYFSCCNFERFKEVDRQTNDFEKRGPRAFTPLECEGYIRFTFSNVVPILVIKHIHRHHMSNRVPRLPNHTQEVIEKSVKASIEQGRVFVTPKKPTVDMIAHKIPGAEYSTVSRIYDKLVNAEFITDRSDFRSLIKFCENNSEDYAYFTFYSVAIILRKVMTELSSMPRIESVSLSSIYHISKHRCEMFIANAAVDHTGIPFGYMFVNRIDKVQDSLGKLGYAKRMHPLPQCNVSASINDTMRTIFCRNDKVILTACFLMLFYGTCQDMGILQSEDGKHIKLTPLNQNVSHEFVDESICRMDARETFGSFFLIRKSQLKCISCYKNRFVHL